MNESFLLREKTEILFKFGNLRVGNVKFVKVLSKNT